jgi:hypothetical protein
LHLSSTTITGVDRSLDDELVRLRDESKPIQAIALIHRELGLPRHKAKDYLRAHPAWHDALATWDERLDELESGTKDL